MRDGKVFTDEAPRRAAKIARLIGEPEAYWIQLEFQDILLEAGLDYYVTVV